MRWRRQASPTRCGRCLTGKPRTRAHARWRLRAGVANRQAKGRLCRGETACVWSAVCQQCYFYRRPHGLAAPVFREQATATWIAGERKKTEPVADTSAALPEKTRVFIGPYSMTASVGFAVLCRIDAGRLWQIAPGARHAVSTDDVRGGVCTASNALTGTGCASLLQYRHTQDDLRVANCRREEMHDTQKKPCSKEHGFSAVTPATMHRRRSASASQRRRLRAAFAEQQLHDDGNSNIECQCDQTGVQRV